MKRERFISIWESVKENPEANLEIYLCCSGNTPFLKRKVGIIEDIVFGEDVCRIVHSPHPISAADTCNFPIGVMTVYFEYSDILAVTTKVFD